MSRPASIQQFHLSPSSISLTLQSQALGTAVGHIMSIFVVISAGRQSQVRRLTAGSCAHQERPFRGRRARPCATLRRHRMETGSADAAFVGQSSEQPSEFKERETHTNRWWWLLE